MIRLFNILVFASAIAVTNAAAEDWTFVAADTTGKITYSYDRSRIGRSGDLVTIWTLEDSTVPLSRGGGFFDLFKEQSYRRVSLLQVDCKKLLYAYATVIVQDKEGRNLESRTDPEDKRVPLQAVPGSIAEKIIRQACIQLYAHEAADKNNYDKSDPPENAFIKPRWDYVGVSADFSHEGYLASDAITIVDPKTPNIRNYLSRLDIKGKPQIRKGRQVVHSVSRWLIDCNTLEMYQGNTAYFGFDGGFVDRDLVPELVAINPGRSTFAASIGKKACDSPNAVQGATNTGAEATPAISTGTGWYVGNGYFITASHVIGDSKKVSGLWNKDQAVELRVVKNDPLNDVALLKATEQVQLKPLQITKSSVSVGARVFTLGYPHVSNLGVEPKFTGGEISSLSGMQDDPRHLQISVPVQSGNSGGPLVNQSGEVVGVINSKLKADKVLKATGDLPQNVNYALKSWFVATLLDGVSIGAETVKRPSKSQEEIAQMLRDSVVLILAQ